MFKKNRTVWGIAALVSSYLSLFISVVFAPNNKRVSFSMLLMSITQLICGLMLIDEEYDLSGTVKEKSTAAYGTVKGKSAAAYGVIKDKSSAAYGAVKSKSADIADKVKSKLRFPVAEEGEELLDEIDLANIEEAISDDLCIDAE